METLKNLIRSVKIRLVLLALLAIAAGALFVARRKGGGLGEIPVLYGHGLCRIRPVFPDGQPQNQSYDGQ